MNKNFVFPRAERMLATNVRHRKTASGPSLGDEEALLKQTMHPMVV